MTRFYEQLAATLAENQPFVLALVAGGVGLLATGFIHDKVLWQSLRLRSAHRSPRPLLLPRFAIFSK